MSATFSSAPRQRGRAKLVIGVVIPLISLVIGINCVIFGIFSWRASILLRAALLAGGGAAAAAGFLALWWGIRAHFNADPLVRAAAAIRADMAIGGVFLVIGIVGVAGKAHELIADTQPALTRDVHLSKVGRMAGRGHHGVDVIVATEPGSLQWECGSDCALQSRLLATPPGSAARVTTIGSNLIGFETGGLSLLDPGIERERLKVRDLWMWIMFIALSAGAAVYMPWRGRALRNLTTPGGNLLRDPAVSDAWRNRKPFT